MVVYACFKSGETFHCGLSLILSHALTYKFWSRRLEKSKIIIFRMKNSKYTTVIFILTGRAPIYGNQHGSINIAEKGHLFSFRVWLGERECIYTRVLKQYFYGLLSCCVNRKMCIIGKSTTAILLLKISHPSMNKYLTMWYKYTSKQIPTRANIKQRSVFRIVERVTSQKKKTF